MDGRKGENEISKNLETRNLLGVSPTRGSVVREVDAYLAIHAKSEGDRKTRYAELVNDYYDLATDFYERGWGASFHFAPRWKYESVRDSINRYEYWLAHQLRLNTHSSVLDVGCGIGGPMRSIAKFSGCRITGINNNGFQIRRAQHLNVAADLMEQCTALRGDFMRMPFKSNTFDAAYAIEATVHAPDLTEAYRDIYRVLKPGGLFATHEWCMTSQFDADRVEHRGIKRAIEIGNGIPSIGHVTDVLQAVERAGFEIMDAEDRMASSEIPWWEPLSPSRFSLSSWRSSLKVGKAANVLMGALEVVHLIPRGASSVGRILAQGGEALVAGGKAGIFTPGFYVLAGKPAS
jgi:sterol 24-C-methyltransferase